MKPLLSVFGLLAMLFFTSSGEAQIPMGAGQAYTQDFDSLALAGTGNGWMDNQTLPGWYAATNASSTKFGPATFYNAGTGSSTAGALYSFGASGASDRALGSLASGTPGDIAYGVRFTNDTSFAQTNFLISYTGEQWRVANVNVQKLAFAYQVGVALTNADAINAQNWTVFPALDFISPNTNATSSLNGNLPANQQVFTNIVLPGLVVQPGQEIFFRWLDEEDSGNDDGLAVDNLTIKFSPAMADTNPVPAFPGLSVMTYNVKGNGTTDWTTNTAQVRAIIRELNYLQPDIITFNEIPYTNTYEMVAWMTALFPQYHLAANSGTDGFIRSVIASRYPIARSKSWLDGADLKPFGYTNTSTSLADNFTRDLFEAEIDVPGFAQPLHVFTTHLKSTAGEGYAEAAAKRAAEAAAITNFLATNFFVLYPTHPYILSGDMNDSNTGTLALQRLFSPATGLRLTSPVNPVTGSINTYSAASPSERIDYIMPCPLLFSNVTAAQVFRTAKLSPLPAGLNSNDDQVASDHLPVLMVFNNPYAQPFRLTSIVRSHATVSLNWNSIPGQAYRVETSTGLLDWTTLADNLQATDYGFNFMTDAPADAAFYRIRRVP